jgi:tetratricopeptide (TPR) repeat protein
MPKRLIAALLLVSAVLSAQTPATFRLVLPHGKGAILIDTGDGWKLQRISLTDNGKRPEVFLTNLSTGLVASYMLEFDPPYYNTSEDCRNDSLGGVVHGLSKATLADKRNDSRILKNGQTIAIGSFLIKKTEGIELNQQNVWGFYAKDHTCATVHLSKTPFRPGDASPFEALLDGFTYDPDYIPTAADYAAMASLLPPDMATTYKSAALGGSPNQPSNPSTLDLGQSLTFALPHHPGYLHLDAPGYIVTELSAKPNGNEFGIRAQDSSISKTEVLGFLFLPQPTQPTAAACRDWMIKLEKSQGDGYAKKVAFYDAHQREMKSESGVDIALVDYKQSNDPTSYQFVRRAFVASGDLCADIKITGVSQINIQAEQSVLDSLKFEPARLPDFNAKFRYASVLYAHHAYAAAAPIFVEALALVDQSGDPRLWRRVTTDQASLAYGISGNLDKSRAINEDAILKDPDYPLYYYNLACADAESGDATAAQTHLRQAFDRGANTLPGEHLPDPTADDSILKLKSNVKFWAFVQELPKN